MTLRATLSTSCNCETVIFGLFASKPKILSFVFNPLAVGQLAFGPLAFGPLAFGPLAFGPLTSS